jgi:radical SAM protein with 4Fe4S-binding SPASM domain
MKKNLGFFQESHLYVNVEGDLFFCAEYPTKEECIGNVLVTPIKELIESKQYQKIKKQPLFKEEKCSVCEFRILCHRCKSYIYYCNMNYISHWCLYNPKNGNLSKKNIY